VLLVPAIRAVSGDAGLHDRWSALLTRHVDNGRVDYEGVRRERAELDGYLTALRAAAPSIAHAGRDQQTAYWINPYNAYTIAFLDHWPVEHLERHAWKQPFGVALDYIPLGTALQSRQGRALVERHRARGPPQTARRPAHPLRAGVRPRGCPPLASAATRPG
jgi:hypothetical protein